MTSSRRPGRGRAASKGPSGAGPKPRSGSEGRKPVAAPGGVTTDGDPPEIEPENLRRGKRHDFLPASGLQPAIVLVGRPNVGKSTLFNQLTRSRDALVADVPGLTRDRQYGIGRVGPFPYFVVDTGGLSGVENEMDAAMAGQTERAIGEADVILFMVDARAGRTPQDDEIATSLRRSGRRVLLLANKIDGLDPETVIGEFFALGLGAPRPIAAAHGRGIQSLMRRIAELLIEDDVLVAAAPLDVDESLAEDDQIHEFDSMDPNDDSDSTGADPEGVQAAETELQPDEVVVATLPGSAGPAAVGGTIDRPLDHKGRRLLEPAVLDDWPGIRVAFVGRPNVGKSTLTNRLLGDDRVVATPVAGTTRDSIFIPFERDGDTYTLIDTAGVRRRGRVDEMVEKFSVIKTLQAIDAAHVVVMVLDARAEVADQDAHLLGLVLEAGRALVIAVNKWDGLDEDERERIRMELERKLSFARFARLRFISALHGTNVGHLLADVREAHASAFFKMSTPKLTRMLEAALAAHPPPLVRGRRIKLRYAHQGGQNPPLIVMHGNQIEEIPGGYKRYLENFFRDQLKLVGTPLRLEFRGTTNPFAGRRNILTPRQLIKRKRMMQHIKKKR